MFSQYIPTMVLMVVLTLQVLIIPKPKKPRKKKHRSGHQKKDKKFRRARKASNKRAHRDYIVQGGGIFGLLPAAILGEINDSLCSAIDRYTLTRSVPELYNSVGRGGIAALKQEADLERHET